MTKWTSWGDSSDDDDSDCEGQERGPPTEDELAANPQPEPDPQAEHEPDAEAAQEEPPAPMKKEFVFPENPPFTAYVGNLSFSIKDSEQFSQQVVDLVKNKLGKELNVTKSRVALDRQQNNKPKGFGYIEFETVEDLKTLLQLANDDAQIAGRPIRLDVAAPQQNNRRSYQPRSSFNNDTTDGAQFRAARHSNSDAPSRQRPSLKLKPRSVDRANPPHPASRNSSAIFGGGKARDVKDWERKSSTDNQKDRPSGAGGRGGRGRGGRTNTTGGRAATAGGRTNTTGGRGRTAAAAGKSDQNKKHRGKGDEGGKKKQEKPKPPPPPATPPVEVDKPAGPFTEKVVNKFAVLDFDDSDEE